MLKKILTIYKKSSIAFIVFVSIVILARLLFNVYFLNGYLEVFYWLSVKYIFPFVIITNVLIHKSKNETIYMFLVKLFTVIFILIIGANFIYNILNMEICSNFPAKLYDHKENLNNHISHQFDDCGPFGNIKESVIYEYNEYYDFFGSNTRVDTNSLDMSEWEKVKR